MDACIRIMFGTNDRGGIAFDTDQPKRISGIVETDDAAMDGSSTMA